MCERAGVDDWVRCLAGNIEAGFEYRRLKHQFRKNMEREHQQLVLTKLDNPRPEGLVSVNLRILPNK